MSSPISASSAYLFQVQLLNTSNPYVMRTLHVPANTTFETLHRTILAALDWSYKVPNTWPFSVVLRDPVTASLLSEVPKILLTIESGLNDCETESESWYEQGESANMGGCL